MKASTAMMSCYLDEVSLHEKNVINLPRITQTHQSKELGRFCDKLWDYCHSITTYSWGGEVTCKGLSFVSIVKVSPNFSSFAWSLI